MKNETNLQGAAEAVANWWATKMQQPLNQDNGTQNEPNGGMMFMMMNMVGSEAQKSITTENIEVFKSKLVENILSSDTTYRIAFGVDYHPDEILQSACVEAGINGGSLPCKSYTWIDTTTFHVAASFGYGGERKIIYPIS